MNFEPASHLGHMKGHPQQQGVDALNPHRNPIAWSAARPKGKLLRRHTVSDLTGASLSPQIRPQQEPQGKVRLRDTSGNPLDHVNQHDVEEARRDVDTSVRLAEQEARGDNHSESIKDKLKKLWKSDLVKGIVFAAVATLALVTIVGLAAAIPFTGGGSAIALVPHHKSFLKNV